MPSAQSVGRLWKFGASRAGNLASVWAILAIALSLVGSIATSATAEEKDTDASIKRAMALLQGVVDQRMTYENLEAEIEILSTDPKTNRALSRLNLKIQQSGRRRRYEQLPDSEEPSVYITDFEADTVHGFIRDDADLRIFSNDYAANRRAVPDFDPRILGMTSQMAHLVTVKQCLLMHQKDLSIELLTPTEEAGIKVQRVRISSGPYSSEYWIAEPKFQLVRRIVIFGPDSSVTVSSTYDPKIADGNLPVTVLIQDRQPKNSLDRVVKLHSIKTDARIPDDAYSLSSIGMPVNTMINDYRKKMIVGYWTGDGIAPDPVQTNK